MSYTMEDFKRDYVKEHFANLPQKEQKEMLRSLSTDVLRSLLSAEQLEQLAQFAAPTAASPKLRKPRRKT